MTFSPSMPIVRDGVTAVPLGCGSDADHSSSPLSSAPGHKHIYPASCSAALVRRMTRQLTTGRFYGAAPGRNAAHEETGGKLSHQASLISHQYHGIAIADGRRGKSSQLLPVVQFSLLVVAHASNHGWKRSSAPIKCPRAAAMAWWLGSRAFCLALRQAVSVTLSLCAHTSIKRGCRGRLETGHACTRARSIESQNCRWFMGERGEATPSGHWPATRKSRVAAAGIDELTLEGRSHRRRQDEQTASSRSDATCLCNAEGLGGQT